MKDTHIDLNRFPKIKDPGRWSRIEHYPGGIAPWNPAALFPYHSLMLPDAGVEKFPNIDKPKILEDIGALPVGNACLFDFIDKDPDAYLPEFCRQWVWHYPATIFFEKKELAFIQCHFWTGERWHASDTLLQTYDEMFDTDTRVDAETAEIITFALYLGSYGVLEEKKILKFK